VLLVSKILASLLIGKENSYVVRGEAGRFQIVGYQDSLRFTLCYTEYCFLGHFRSLLLSFDFELVVDVACARDRLRLAHDNDFFRFGVDGTAQNDIAIRGDDLHVMR
jgi:hypothetical protein